MARTEMVVAVSLLTVPKKAWLLLFAGPVLFLAGIVGASAFLGFQGIDAGQIARRVPLLMPEILLGVSASLGLLLFLALRHEAVWTLPPAPKGLRDAAFGVLAGGLLALSYLFLLSPALEFLQRAVGDYVPPGSVLPTVSASIGLFFIANVLLAPLVEETLYRGYAIPVLTRSIGKPWAVVLSCFLFGLLHWAGGLWYMALVGGLAGGVLAGLFLWRSGLLAPFVAHLTLNSIEFIFASRLAHGA
jgi:uncharacterized protein